MTTSNLTQVGVDAWSYLSSLNWPYVALVFATFLGTGYVFSIGFDFWKRFKKQTDWKEKSDAYIVKIITILTGFVSMVEYFIPVINQNQDMLTRFLGTWFVIILGYFLGAKKIANGIAVFLESVRSVGLQNLQIRIMKKDPVPAQAEDSGDVWVQNQP